MSFFYCEYCGYKAGSVQSLTCMSCIRHPAGPNKGKHKLYEGSEKAMYTCKYCGYHVGSIQTLTRYQRSDKLNLYIQLSDVFFQGKQNVTVI